MNPLLKRLTQQLADQGVWDAEAMAVELLTKRGHMKDGELTELGWQRQELGDAGRAKDRAAKRSGGSPDDYIYNPETNRATRRK